MSEPGFSPVRPCRLMPPCKVGPPLRNYVKSRRAHVYQCTLVVAGNQHRVKVAARSNDSSDELLRLQQELLAQVSNALVSLMHAEFTPWPSALRDAHLCNNFGC